MELLNFPCQLRPRLCHKWLRMSHTRGVPNCWFKDCLQKTHLNSCMIISPTNRNTYFCAEMLVQGF